MKSFFFNFFLFILVVCCLNVCWWYFMPNETHIPLVWPMVTFFSVITLIFHNRSLKASKGKPQEFIRFFMGSTALRLFTYTLIILIYGLLDKFTLIPFAVGFLAHYILFSAFELPILLRELKKTH